MSKVSEQKVLETYPEDYAWCKCDDDEEVNYTEIDDEGTKWLKVDCNEEFRTVYIRCYDQAMQDFLEKACEWIENTQLENFICRDDGVYFDNEKFVEQFKKLYEK